MKKLFCLLPLVAALFLATGCDEEEDKKSTAITSSIGLFEYVTLTDSEGLFTYPEHIQDGPDDFWVRGFIEISESRVRLYSKEYDFADGSPDGVYYSSYDDSTVTEITDTQIITNQEVISYVINGSTITFTVVMNGETTTDAVIVAKVGNSADIAGAIDSYSLRTKATRKR
jgi:hypothetical protein